MVFGQRKSHFDQDRSILRCQYNFKTLGGYNKQSTCQGVDFLGIGYLGLEWMVSNLETISTNRPRWSKSN